MRNNCSCFDGIIENIEEWNDYTGHDRWNAVYTIQLGELLDAGVFDWSKPVLNWRNAAYDNEQYSRVCAYFIERFYYREISIEPFEEWARLLHSRLVFELMPKYRIQYEQAERDWDIATNGREWGESSDSKTSTATGSSTQTENEDKDEYYKGRDIGSNYPETLLSANSDYITTGNDSEHETVSERERTSTGNTSDNAQSSGNAAYEKFKHLPTAEFVEATRLYSEFFGTVDRRLLDELESFFIGMYTTNVNATW